MKRVLGTLASLLIALGLAPSARAEDWSQEGGDAARGGRSQERVGPGGDLLWSAQGEACEAGLVVGEGVVVQTERGGVVRARRAEDGASLWTRDLETRDLRATPALGAGRLVVALGSGEVVCLALADGALLWRSAGQGGPRAALAIGGEPGQEQVLISEGFPSRRLRALDLRSGAERWAATLDQVAYSAPALRDGLVVVGSNGGQLAARRLSDGSPAWTYETAGRFLLAGPSLSAHAAAFAPGGEDPRLYGLSLDRAQAAADWSLRLDDPQAATWPSWALMGLQRAASTPTRVGSRLAIVVRYDYVLDTQAPWWVADTYVSRERLFVVDPSGPSVVWQANLGAITSSEAEAVPALGRCPAPVAMGDGSEDWLAVASSLGATLGFYRARDGAEQGGFSVSGNRWAAASTPALADARLFAVTSTGRVEARGLGGNQAPGAPQSELAAGVTLGDEARPTLRWRPAVDPNDPASSLVYEVRIDADGEVLLDAEQRTLTSAGATSWQVASPLTSDLPYTYAIRARDPQGAWSPWSEPRALRTAQVPAPPREVLLTSRPTSLQLTWESSPSPQVHSYRLWFGAVGEPLGDPLELGKVQAHVLGGLRRGRRYRARLVAVSSLGLESSPVELEGAPEPRVRVGRHVASGLVNALAQARPGDVVRLGAGRFELGASLRVPAGVVLRGAGPGQTVIRGGSLADVVVELGSVEGEDPARLEHLAVQGGRVAVEVRAGRAELRHVLIYGVEDGLAVAEQSELSAEFLTIADCANRGARVDGLLSLRHALVTGCAVGLEVGPQGSANVRYSAIAGNQRDRSPEAEADPSTVALAPLFVAPERGDYRVDSASPSVDAGDPEAEVAEEFWPHGDRVNLGAFGATRDAARTPPPPPVVPRSQRACALSSPEGSELPGALAALLLALTALRLPRRPA